MKSTLKNYSKGGKEEDGTGVLGFEDAAWRPANDKLYSRTACIVGSTKDRNTSSICNGLKRLRRSIHQIKTARKPREIVCASSVSSAPLHKPSHGWTIRRMGNNRIHADRRNSTRVGFVTEKLGLGIECCELALSSVAQEYGSTKSRMPRKPTILPCVSFVVLTFPSMRPGAPINESPNWRPFWQNLGNLHRCSGCLYSASSHGWKGTKKPHSAKLSPERCKEP